MVLERRARTLALALVGLAAAAPALRGQGDGEQPRGFAIPQTRAAQTLAQRALGHLDALRWAEAVADLRELIVAHRGAVLRPPGGSANDAPGVEYVGAAAWAQARLAAAPEQVRALYRTRYGAESRAALAAARRTRERRELLEVARRYPLTEAACEAWWTLGDLEFESGGLADARVAWSRAAALARDFGEVGPGAALRLELARALDDAPASADAAPPALDCATWDQSLRREDVASTPLGSGEQYSVYACASGDTLLASDTLVVWAFDAWSGEPRWRSVEHERWRAVDAGRVRPNGTRPLARAEFFANLDARTLIVRPAAAAGVAVAALQVPFSDVYNDQFQNYGITRVLPERRLFAFDLESGRPLWDHAPAPDWDGEGGPFERRMCAGAAPVIAGSRVLVPSFRVQGRIDLHVACYDLFNGQLLWSSALISGQGELNMFGRQEHEFNAAPVTVAGERVIVLTQLGALAALDLFSGEILWETLYEQLAVPRTDFGHRPERRQVFANCAPVVAAGVVLAAPVDAGQLLAFDLASGAPLWSRDYESPARSRYDQLALLGADDQRVWLAGSRILALRAPRGLGTAGGPRETSESRPVSDQAPRPRPALTASHVIAASRERRIALDRAALTQEDRLASAPWRDGTAPGNVTAADGALYFANSRQVSACIDWRAVEQRFRTRSERAPDDPRPALDWAALLARRGQIELDATRTGTALALFETARAKLEPFLEQAGTREPPALRARLSALLLDEARALEAAADPKAALARVERALELAGDESALCRALVRKCELLELLGQRAERAAALAVLDQRCGTSPMPADWWERSGRARFVESVPRDAASGPLEVALYVALEDALDAAAQRDVAREFELLHALLARWGDVVLPAQRDDSDAAPRATVSARIGALLAQGALEAYAPFEARARAWFDEARAKDDLAALVRLPLLFPHSAAAREAEGARLHAALESGDIEQVVALVQRSLPDDGSIATARDGEIDDLRVLAAALDDIGNRELAARLLRHIGAVRGSVVSSLARDAGRSMAELAGPEPEVAAPRTTAERSTFDARSSVVERQPGPHALLGTLDIAAADGTLQPAQVVAALGKQAVVSVRLASAPQTQLWAQRLEPDAVHSGWPARVSGGVLIVGGRLGLTGLQPERGERLWRWRPSAAGLESFEVDGGLIVCVTRAGDASRVLVALEATRGVELWARALPPSAWEHPIVGREHIVLLPKDWAASPATVLDPFTGSRCGFFALPAHVGESDAQSAWIEGARLVLPSFPKSSAEREPDCISAWDLDSGRRVWRVTVEAGRQFDSIVRHDGRTYLIHLAAGAPGRGSAGAVQELDTRIGAVRRLQNVALGVDDLPVGVQRHHRVDLDGPYLFLRSPSPDGRETLLRAILLPYGERWSCRLPMSAAQSNNAPMMLPILSQSSAVFVYTLTPRSRGAASVPSTTLLVLDRDNGLVRATSALPAELGTADVLQMSSLEGSLWIAGNAALLTRSKP